MSHWLLLLLVALAGAALVVMALALADGFRARAHAARLARQSAARARPLTLTVVARQDITVDHFTLTLAAPRNSPLPAFQPGQYLRLEIPGVGDARVNRAYSLAAWQPRPRRYELAIKREANGRGSGWLHTHARPGAQLTAAAPAGRFILAGDTAAGSIVLVAGGIGITPLRAMLHRLAVLPARRRPQTTLHYSVRRREELLYDSEFRDLATAGWLSYRPRITGEGAPRLAADELLADLAVPTGAQFFFCAGEAMIDVLAAGLLARGVPSAALHRESFGAATTNADHTAYRIRLGAREFPFQAAPSLLAACEGAGIAIDAECRQGECGRCRVQVIAGQTRQLLPAAQPLPAGEVLACCTVPASDLILDVVPATSAGHP